MLDALVVANGVRDGRVDPAWDLDCDGSVTRAEVDRVAIAAVRLDLGKAIP